MLKSKTKNDRIIQLTMARPRWWSSTCSAAEKNMQLLTKMAKYGVGLNGLIQPCRSTFSRT
jgi:hypothetical protein